MRTKWLGRWMLVALALTALAACGDGESGGGALAALGVKDGASKGVSKSAEVTADKATTISLATGAQLEVPKGAVEKNLTITMERPADSKALDLVEKFKKDQDRIASAPYVLKPHGTQFNEEVIVTLPLSKGGSREVSVAWLEDENDTEWKNLGVAKSDGKNAQIAIKHFSVLVLVEDASDLEPVDEIPSQRDDAGAGVQDAGGADEEVDAASGLDAGLDAASETDAGPGGADRDASISVPVDTGTRLDAGTGGEMDAVAPVADAGAQLDATTAPDVTDPNQPDAGDQLPDTGTAPVDTGAGDASVAPDAGPTLPDAAGAMYAKLLQCGHLAQTGGYSIDHSPDSVQACELRCYAQGTCDEALSVRCPSIPINDGGGLEPATLSCIQACHNFVCPDQTAATRCNESSECANGEDEQFCWSGGAFQCGSGEKIDFWYQCNTYLDCLDNSDEEGCFQCGSGGYVRPSQVCDGVQNCGDGSDEANCAGVACPAPV